MWHTTNPFKHIYDHLSIIEISKITENALNDFSILVMDFFVFVYCIRNKNNWKPMHFQLQMILWGGEHLITLSGLFLNCVIVIDKIMPGWYVSR